METNTKRKCFKHWKSYMCHKKSVSPRSPAQATVDVLICNDDFVARANYDAILNAKYSIDGRAASDHQAIQVEIHFEHHAAHRPSIMQYSFCKADYDELDRSIATDPFEGICWSNPKVLLSQWHNWLDEKLKATVPARTKHRKSLPPWVSQEDSSLLKRVQSLQRNGNSDKTEKAIEACDRQLKTDQQHYETLLADNRDGNKLFIYYRTIKKPPVVPPSMFRNGTIATTDREIANLFDMFFRSVFSQKEQNQERQDEASTGPTLVNYDVSENKVLSIISYLMKTNLVGTTNSQPLSKKTPVLSKSISHLFKAIKDKCKFPDASKTGKIKPIYKKGGKSLCNNYRSITLLCILSKILEKCKFDSLFPYVANLIHQSQHGFQKRKSTIYQLLVYLGTIYSNKTADTYIEAVYLDFAKAFDKIDNSILINKLKHIGVGGKLLSIIEDYLSNRKQYGEINGTASDLLLVLSGVTQGSLLGPLLFLLYIYDTPRNCALFSFADDSKLLSIHKLYEASNLQENLDIIHQWCSKHRMQFNVSKRAHMCFAGSPCQNLTLADEPVPFSLSTQDLGLHVTADLKWNVHIQETTCKAFSALCFLKRNTLEGLSTSTKLKLVKSMVLPILLYGSTVWYASKTNLRKLEQTQWKAVKWVLAYGEPNYTVALKRLNLLPLISVPRIERYSTSFQYHIEQNWLRLATIPETITEIKPAFWPNAYFKWRATPKLLVSKREACKSFTPDDKPVSTRRP